MTYPRSLLRKAVRDYDVAAMANGLTGAVLMENAARGACDILMGLGASGPISIVCGKGNNAGDGFVMARLLGGMGMTVSVEMLVDPVELTGDASNAFRTLRHIAIPMKRADGKLLERLRRSEWIVDALLGTGTRGEIRPPFASAIKTVLDARRKVLAVDLPSGLDCDTGKPLGPTIRASHTATFVARKRGFDNPESEAYTGRVHVVPIGAGYLKGFESAEDPARVSL